MVRATDPRVWTANGRGLHRATSPAIAHWRTSGSASAPKSAIWRSSEPRHGGYWREHMPSVWWHGKNRGQDLSSLRRYWQNCGGHRRRLEALTSTPDCNGLTARLGTHTLTQVPQADFTEVARLPARLLLWRPRSHSRRNCGQVAARFRYQRQDLYSRRSSGASLSH
jgi:hypothetical protein